jgi:hypothetical protein
MATIARTLSRIVPSADTESDALTTIALFCAAGLFVALLMASYGADLGGGYF